MMTHDDERRQVESRYYRSGGTDPDEYDNQEPESDREFGLKWQRKVLDKMREKTK
jgi:hypothetical protein